jgi:hypothetical protein
VDGNKRIRMEIRDQEGNEREAVRNEEGIKRKEWK